MGVVELDGDLGRERVEAAGVIPLVSRDDVSQRAGDEEVLLDQPQLLTGGHRVGRIEDLGDGLGGDLLFHGLHVVARVEDLHVEVMRRPCGEEPEEVHRPAPVADDGEIVGHADQEPPVQPHRVVLAPAVYAVLDAAIDGDEARLLGPLDLPGRREGAPVVRLFPLVAVVDLLAEQPVVVVDAVAVAGHVERGQRVQEAGREPAEPAVAERSIPLALLHEPEVYPDASERVPTEVVDAQIDQVIGQGPSEKILDGQVVDVLGGRPPMAFSGLDQPVDQEVPHCEADALEELVWRKGSPCLDQRVSGVSLDGFPQRGRRHREIVPTVARSLHRKSPPRRALRRPSAPGQSHSVCSRGTHPTPMPLIVSRRTGGCGSRMTGQVSCTHRSGVIGSDDGGLFSRQTALVPIAGASPGVRAVARAAPLCAHRGPGLHRVSPAAA